MCMCVYIYIYAYVVGMKWDRGDPPRTVPIERVSWNCPEKRITNRWNIQALIPIRMI